MVMAEALVGAGMEVMVQGAAVGTAGKATTIGAVRRVTELVVEVTQAAVHNRAHRDDGTQRRYGSAMAVGATGVAQRKWGGSGIEPACSAAPPHCRQARKAARQPVLDGTQTGISGMVATATAGRRGKGGKPVFSKQEVKGLQVHNYREGYARHFEAPAGAGDEASAEAMLRRECRGLVVGPQGVVARPIHKFFEEGQGRDTKHGQVANDIVTDARKKLDGAMVFGVVHPTEGWTAQDGALDEGRS